jgi:O-antigen/teichoic acid export membrane protein
VLILRSLTETNSGLFVLFQAASQLITMVSSLGQPTLIQRMYSATKPGNFNWRRDLGRSFSISGPLIGLGTVLALFIYNFDPIVGVLIIIQSSLLLSILILAKMLNAFRLYSQGSTLLRLPNGLLILPAVLFTLLPQIADLTTLLIFQVSLTALTFLVGFLALHRSLPAGKSTISIGQRFQSVIFLVTQFSYQGPELGLTAITGYLLLPGRLAVYQAAAVFIRPFALLGDVLRTIFTTELIRRETVRRKHIGMALWALSALMAAMIIFPGVTVFRWIYGDKYIEGAALLPLIALAGAFILPEVLPRSLLIGQAAFKMISRYATAQVILALLVLASSVFWIQSMEIRGIAVTVVTINLGRFLTSRYFSRNAEIA